MKGIVKRKIIIGLPLVFIGLLVFCTGIAYHNIGMHRATTTMDVIRKVLLKGAPEAKGLQADLSVMAQIEKAAKDFKAGNVPDGAVEVDGFSGVYLVPIKTVAKEGAVFMAKDKPAKALAGVEVAQAKILSQIGAFVGVPTTATVETWQAGPKTSSAGRIMLADEVIETNAEFLRGLASMPEAENARTFSQILAQFRITVNRRGYDDAIAAFRERFDSNAIAVITLTEGENVHLLLKMVETVEGTELSPMAVLVANPAGENAQTPVALLTEDQLDELVTGLPPTQGFDNAREMLETLMGEQVFAKASSAGIKLRLLDEPVNVVDISKEALVDRGISADLAKKLADRLNKLNNRDNTTAIAYDLLVKPAFEDINLLHPYIGLSRDMKASLVLVKPDIRGNLPPVAILFTAEEDTLRVNIADFTGSQMLSLSKSSIAHDSAVKGALKEAATVLLLKAATGKSAVAGETRTIAGIVSVKVPANTRIESVKASGLLLNIARLNRKNPNITAESVIRSGTESPLRKQYFVLALQLARNEVLALVRAPRSGQDVETAPIKGAVIDKGRIVTEYSTVTEIIDVEELEKIAAEANLTAPQEAALGEFIRSTPKAASAGKVPAGMYQFVLEPAQIKQLGANEETIGTLDWDLGKLKQAEGIAGITLAEAPKDIKKAKAKIEKLLEEVRPLSVEPGKITTEEEIVQAKAGRKIERIFVPISAKEVIVMEEPAGTYKPVMAKKEVSNIMKQAKIERGAMLIDFNALGRTAPRKDGSEVFVPNDYLMKAITILNNLKDQKMADGTTPRYHVAVYSDNVSAEKMRSQLGALAVPLADNFIQTPTVAEAVAQIAQKQNISPERFVVTIAQSTIKRNPNVLGKLAEAVKLAMVKTPKVGEYASYKAMLLQSLRLLEGILTPQQIEGLEGSIKDAPAIKGITVEPEKDEDKAISRMQAAVSV